MDLRLRPPPAAHHPPPILHARPQSGTIAKHLMIGQTIAHYRITAKLGEGGMGVVYRASDTKLDRDVAIKVLPPEVANEPDRLARFEREAKTLASLNHPNIAAIYGVEQNALVMELVEGPTLADRLSSGPIPPDEAISIAIQIAEALEAAHEKAIVHRDLKPANIKLTLSHQVKLLDFGLAKAIESTRSIPADPVNSPTLVAASTPGIIMGTAGYMSPEQAKGHPVDKRADIWAFGVVLHEMLTGRPLFDSGSIAEALASVLRAGIDFTKLPPQTPPHIPALLRRCLDRNVKTRLRDIGEARVLLSEPPSLPQPPHPPAAKPSPLPWAVAALCLLAAPAAWMLRPLPPAPLMRLEILPPEGISMGSPANQQLAVSPDGSAIVYIATDRSNRRTLWIRRLSEHTSIPLAGTENARLPAWSPDSLSISFNADGKLKRIPAVGGAVQTLAETNVGGGWSPDGFLYLSGTNLPRVPASGGAIAPTFSNYPVPVLASVRLLPNGKGFFFLHPSGAHFATIDGAPPRLLPGPIGSPVTFAPHPNGGGSALYHSDDRQLHARPFDPAQGAFLADPVPIAGPVPGGTSWSASSNGVLAFRLASVPLSQLTWLGRDGKPLSRLGDPGNFEVVRLSPNGLFVITAPQRGTFSLFDLEKDRTTRPFPAILSTAPVWSADSKRISFRNVTENKIVTRDIEGGGLLAPGGNSDRLFPSALSHDGRWMIAIQSIGPSQASLLDTTRNVPPLPLRLGNVRSPALSPDNRWLAYSANSEIQPEVRVIPWSPDRLDNIGDRGWQISTTGGIQPAWRADGKELYFVSSDGKTMMAVPLEVNGDSLRPGTPVPLFPVDLRTNANIREYDVTPDGKRFLIPIPISSSEVPISVIINWHRLLDRK